MGVFQHDPTTYQQYTGETADDIGRVRAAVQAGDAAPGLILTRHDEGVVVEVGTTSPYRGEEFAADVFDRVGDTYVERDGNVYRALYRSRSEVREAEAQTVYVGEDSVEFHIRVYGVGWTPISCTRIDGTPKIRYASTPALRRLVALAE